MELENKRKEQGWNKLVKNHIQRKLLDFVKEEDGMGVVEIVLIIIVLVGLVILFKDKITAIVNTILSKMTSQIKQI